MHFNLGKHIKGIINANLPPPPKTFNTKARVRNGIFIKSSRLRPCKGPHKNLEAKNVVYGPLGTLGMVRSL